MPTFDISYMIGIAQIASLVTILTAIGVAFRYLKSSYKNLLDDRLKRSEANIANAQQWKEIQAQLASITKSMAVFNHNSTRIVDALVDAKILKREDIQVDEVE